MSKQQNANISEYSRFPRSPNAKSSRSPTSRSPNAKSSRSPNTKSQRPNKKFVLIDWFPYNKLSYATLSFNINAIDFLSLSENKKLIFWVMLSLNPNAIDFLSLPENRKYINYSNLSLNTNPKAIKLLKKYIEEEKNKKGLRYFEINNVDWNRLSENNTDEAIELLMKKYEEEKQLSLQQYEYEYQKIDWEKLSSNTNPKAIKLFLENIENINNRFEFSRNPCNAAIKFLKDNPTYIDWKGLSRNTNPIAIDLIIEKIKKGEELNDIDWDALSENPSIFIPYKNNITNKIKIVTRILLSKVPSIAQTRITDLQEDLREKVVEELLKISKNELRKGIPIEKLNWFYLSENPNAIDLIRERIEIEKKLSDDEYDRLSFKSKVSWDNLSSNTASDAIELLEENYDKINWDFLSNNPKAIHLLEGRVKYQLKLEEEGKLNSLYENKQINWNRLSENPSIFVKIE
jgi:hypothetical protein